MDSKRRILIVVAIAVTLLLIVMIVVRMNGTKPSLKGENASENTSEQHLDTYNADNSQEIYGDKLESDELDSSQGDQLSVSHTSVESAILKEKLTLADGAEYYGEVKDGKPNGKGTMKWENEETYSGDWMDGERSGYGIYKYTDQEMYDEGGNVTTIEYTGNWKNDKYHGNGTLITRTTIFESYKSEDHFINEINKGEFINNEFMNGYSGKTISNQNAVSLKYEDQDILVQITDEIDYSGLWKFDIERSLFDQDTNGGLMVGYMKKSTEENPYILALSQSGMGDASDYKVLIREGTYYDATELFSEYPDQIETGIEIFSLENSLILHSNFIDGVEDLTEDGNEEWYETGVFNFDAAWNEYGNKFMSYIKPYKIELSELYNYIEPTQEQLRGRS